MKARYSNIFLCIVMLLFAACMGVEESPVPGDYSAPQLTLNEVSLQEASFGIELTATVNYLSDNEGLKDCGFLYSVDPDFQMPYLISLGTCVENTFSSVLMFDDFGQKYYFKAYITNGIDEIMSDVKSFIVPDFDTHVHFGGVSVDSYTENTARVSFTANVDNGIKEIERGIELSDNQSFGNARQFVDNQNVNGRGSVLLSELTPGRKYYIRPYVTYKATIVYGEISGLMVYAIPTLKTSQVTLIESDRAVCGATGIDDFGSEIVEKGLVWSKNGNPTAERDSKSVNGSGQADFSAVMTGLEPGTLYYVRAYATNGEGTGYGVEKSFTTLAVAPSVTTSKVIVEGSTVTLGGMVTATGGADIVERGVVWSKNENPTVSDNKKVLGEGIGNFSTTISGLSPTDMYYVRAYAINDIGISYGEQIKFAMYAKPESITIDKYKVELYEGESVTLKADVSPTGSRQDVIWSSSNESVVAVSADGLVMAKRAGMAIISAEATDNPAVKAQCSVTVKRHVTGVSLSETSLSLLVGETYGLTATVVPSDVTDRSVTWTSSNSSVAAVNSTGQVTAKSQGTATITVKTVDGSKTATCTVTVISLQLPGVSTSSPSAVSISSATVGGNVSSDGGASVTERGVVWSTYSSPTLSDNRKAVGSGTGSFSTTLTGLKASTKYYVRAYAINSVGTAYGSSYSFTTTADGGTESVGNDDYDWGDIGGNSTHEYVDLGLSVKWATCNIGASKPEEYGDYFAWGETEPYYEPGFAREDPQSHWKSSKSGGYYWSSYKYCNGSLRTLTKYCYDSSYGYNGYTDSKTVLDPEDDAAHVNWGGSWRMPTCAEQDELRTNCTWTWTTINGIKGYKVQSNKSGYTDRWIFLPAAGSRFCTDLDDVGSYGRYGSSLFYTGFPGYAFGLNFDSGSCSTDFYSRFVGFSVRPVCH